MDKLLFRRILMIALSVLAVVYAAYLLISTNFKMYPTENAVQTTVTDKIYSNGFIIRDENMIQNNTSGVLSYTVHDGDEVKAGGEIAKSYANDDDAASQSKISALQEQLSDLQTLQKTSTAGNIGIDTINNNINNNIISQIRIRLNALGSYVHTMRLQYVEMFGKFYEGGGKQFKPFKLNSKYIKIQEDKSK